MHTGFNLCIKILTSSDSFLNMLAHACDIIAPMAVPPMKQMSGTSGCLTRASPVTAPDPNTMFTTPAGTPGEWKAPYDYFGFILRGGGPRVVVITAAFHVRVRGSVPGLGGLKETKNVSSPSTCESQYCGEPP